MSSEVCPFCGKTYKRLKSHLPHCKAAANTQKTPTTSNQTSSSELVTETSEQRETRSQSKKKSNVSAASLQSPSAAVAAKVASASSSPTSTYSVPSPLSQNKKTKVSEQIKRTSTPQLPLSTSSTAVSKKKSLAAAKQAATCDQGTPQETISASSDLHSGSKTTAQTTGTDVISEKYKLTTDSKGKGPSKKKTAKTKKAVESRPIKSDLPDSKLEKSTNKPCVGDAFWKDNTAESKDLTESETTCGVVHHPARITVQGVRAMLGRAKTTPESSRGSKNTDNLSIKTHLDSGLSSGTAPAENHTDTGRALHPSRTLSNHLPSTSLQQTDLQLVTHSSTSLIPLNHNNSSSQSKQTFPAAPLPYGHLSAQLSLAANKGVMTEALKSNQTLSLSVSPHRISTPHLCPPASHTLPLRTDWQKATLQERKPNTAHILTEGFEHKTQDAGTQRLLGQVRLRELPEWCACRVPGHPRDVVDMVQKGWHWYCRKYFYVRKGGVGGLSMLLAGYCVLGYIWNYSHIKRDRWRKYH